MSWHSVWQDWLEWLEPLWMRYMVAPGRKIKRHLNTPIKRKKPVEKAKPTPAAIVAKATPVMPPTAPVRLAEPSPVLYREQSCEVCGAPLPMTVHRTHDGHWRCAPHKGVTCDTCGRAPLPVTLPDQPWQCAAHHG